MSAQVQSIAEWMATVIKLTAPAIRPDVAYVQASGMSPIQELEPDGMLSMREFQVQSGPIVEMGEFIGPCYELWREMDVVMRYMRDERQGDEWREVDRMAASDFDRVLLALTRPPLQSPWSSAGVWNIQFSAHDKLAKSERFKGVWEQRIVCRVLYSVTDLVQDWAYFVIFTDLGLLLATPDKLNTIRRYVDANGDLIADYRYDGTTWVELTGGDVSLLQPVYGTVKTLPQSTQTARFTVSGDCVVFQIDSLVTTAFEAQANDMKWVASPTAGADVDMCAVLDVNGAAAGGTLGITGTITEALVLTSGGAGQSQDRGVIVHAGTIGLSTSASSTGAAKTTIHYAPLESGATITEI